MSGLKIVLPTLFTDSTLPVFQDDMRFPQKGALLLADVRTMDQGAIYGAIPNVARSQALKLIPNGGAMAAAMEKVGSPADSAFSYSRTPKGGLLVRPTATNTGQGLQVRIPDEIKSYLWSKAATNQFGISVWQAPVKVPSANYLSPFNIGKTDQAYLAYGNKYSPNPTNDRVVGMLGAPTVSNAWNAPEYVGKPQRMNLFPINFRNNNGEIQATPDIGSSFAAYYWGTLGMADPLSVSVFYSMYIEDLTVSGRTPAQFQAADAAAFDAAFGNGGALYGDTVPTS